MRQTLDNEQSIQAGKLCVNVAQNLLDKVLKSVPGNAQEKLFNVNML